jgi:hypothetical protein
LAAFLGVLVAFVPFDTFAFAAARL